MKIVVTIKKKRIFTLLKNCHPGRPRSRENDQTIRAELAIEAITAENASVVTMAVITVAPAIEPVAWVKISMNGYPVGLAAAAVRSPAQKRTAINIAKASTPLMKMLATMDRGTTEEASLISSDI